MKFKFEDLAIYNVDVNYLQYLYNVDHEVYYSPHGYGTKPFLGLVIGAGTYKYFIPFTSCKAKHLKWRTSSDEHYLVYEFTSKHRVLKGCYYKPYDKLLNMHLLSVLDIKKMIPVPDSAYTKVPINSITDIPYRDLLLKEYNFCKSIQNDIENSATKIYEEQKSKGIVYPYYCNFSKLEVGCDEYKRK